MKSTISFLTSATAWIHLSQMHTEESVTLHDAALGNSHWAQQALLRTLAWLEHRPDLKPRYLEIACGMAFVFSLHQRLQSLLKLAVAHQDATGSAALLEAQQRFSNRLAAWAEIADDLTPEALITPRIVEAALARAPQTASTQALRGLIQSTQGAAGSDPTLHINTEALTDAALGYSTAQRPVQSNPERALTTTLTGFALLTVTKSPIDLRDRFTADSASEIKLGWLNGRPVMLQRVWNVLESNPNLNWMEGGQGLTSARHAYLASMLGIGPRFHGLRPSYNTQTGLLQGYYQVTDIVPGQFTDTVQCATVTSQTFSDLENIRLRLKPLQDQLPFELAGFDLRVTPEGRMMLITNRSNGRTGLGMNESEFNQVFDLQRAHLIQRASPQMANAYVSWLKNHHPVNWSRLKPHLPSAGPDRVDTVTQETPDLRGSNPVDASVSPPSNPGSTPQPASQQPRSEHTPGNQPWPRLAEKNPESALSQVLTDFQYVNVTLPTSPSTSHPQIVNGQLGWMGNKPVALERIEPSQNPDADARNWTSGGLSLLTAINADLLSRLGIGPRFHGLHMSFNTETQRREYSVVTDPVSGELLHLTKNTHLISDQTFRDLENVLLRLQLIQKQIEVFSFDFYLTPEGRLVVRNSPTFALVKTRNPQQIEADRERMADNYRTLLIERAPKWVAERYGAWLKDTKPGEWERIARPETNESDSSSSWPSSLLKRKPQRSGK